MMNRRLPAWWLAGLALMAVGAEALAQSAEKLPRWRGFNLVDKFTLRRNRPFSEEDFRLISEWGFNFVRLPMDYRIWIKDGDWRRFNEDALKEIDQAVEYGKRHGIHVCINFHRAPGYCVNPPKEPKDLWSDAEAQEVCALHWATFARRYRGIPNSRLSFNLLNEPARIDPKTNLKVAKILVEAIRKEDPDRLIIADGLQWGNRPAEDLLPLRVAQSTRGYQPMEISHYRASWVGKGRTWYEPTWPLREGLNAHLHGDNKKDKAGPLTLKGSFPEGCEIGITVGVVSSRAKLVVRADGEVVFEKEFVPGPGKGEWKKSVYSEQYKIYQNVYEREYVARIPRAAREVQIENAKGDWMTFTRLRLRPYPGAPGDEAVITPKRNKWGVKQGTYDLDAAGSISGDRVLYDRETHWERQIEPWLAFQKKGVGVIVGEWGAYRYTPHPVALAWMEDCLKNWKKAGWGWALWNFRGSFGILDSGREDVKYEDFRGHKLDRKMLDLLRKY